MVKIVLYKNETQEKIFWATVLLICGIIIAHIFLTTDVYSCFDMDFHLKRIEGIKEGLLSGQFPVRIQAYQYNGYGTPIGYFYPDMLYYIPAFLRIIGVPLGIAHNIYWSMITFGGLYLSWYAYAKWMKSISGGAVASVFFNSMFYFTFGQGGSVGIATSMIFMPLIFMAMYSVLFEVNGWKKWPLLVIGMTGVIQSHVINTLFSILCCGIMLIYGYHNFLIVDRYKALAKATLTTMLINMWSIIPFFYMYPKIDFHIKHSAENFLSSIHVFTSGFKGLWDAQFWWGWPLIIAMFFCAILRLQEYHKWKGLYWSIGLCLLITCGISKYFPWEYIELIPFLGDGLKQIQFSIRFTVLGGIVVCLYVGKSLSDYFSLYKYSGVILAVICISASFFSAYNKHNMSFELAGNTAVYSTAKYDINKLNSYGHNEDYLYNDIKFVEMRNKNGELPQSDDYYTDANILYTKKIGTSIDMQYESPVATPVQLPLFYYPGYEAKLVDNDTKVELKEGKQHIMLAELPAGKHDLEIRYKENNLFRICNVISIVSSVLFFYTCFLANLRDK